LLPSVKGFRSRHIRTEPTLITLASGFEAASQPWILAGRTIFVADGKRFVVHADEKLTAFVELEAVIFYGVNP
jgi:hypothetical protein